MITKGNMNVDQKIKSVLKQIDETWGHDYPDWLDDDTNLSKIPKPEKELYFYESDSFTTDNIDKAVVQTKRIVKLVNTCEKEFVIKSLGYTLYNKKEDTKVKYVLGICTTDYLGESISFEGVKNFYKRVKLQRPIIKDLPLTTYLTSGSLSSAAPFIDIEDWSLFGGSGNEIIMLADRVRGFKTPKI